MASTTTTFLKTRAAASAPIKTGQWHASFSKMKKFAGENKIPFIAVWSNGDACSHCINFEKSIMQSAFTTWMKSSGCAFWFGCSSDKTSDDKFEGTGFNWTRNNTLTTYPFVRVYWKVGKVDQYKSGDDWTGGKATGGATFVKKLKALLKDFNPSSNTPSEPEPTEPDCAGECEVDNSNCDNVATAISQAQAELEANGMTKQFGYDILSVVKQLQNCKCDN